MKYLRVRFKKNWNQVWEFVGKFGNLRPFNCFNMFFFQQVFTFLRQFCGLLRPISRLSHGTPINGGEPRFWQCWNSHFPSFFSQNIVDPHINIQWNQRFIIRRFIHVYPSKQLKYHHPMIYISSLACFTDLSSLTCHVSPWKWHPIGMAPFHPIPVTIPP